MTGKLEKGDKALYTHRDSGSFFTEIEIVEIKEITTDGQGFEVITIIRFGDTEETVSPEEIHSKEYILRMFED